MNTTIIQPGFLLVYKPVGMTSFDCIIQLKKLISQKIKIGHAGTLDPFASGLLVVAIGREATRLLPDVMALKKTYIAYAKFGELTDTLDCTGTLIHVEAISHLSLNNYIIESVLAAFGNSYEQTPPIYSALKHKGQPLYKLVRQAKMDDAALSAIVHSKRKTVQLYDLQFVSCSLPFFTINACVSQGTYIRSLVNDIAVRCGTFATTYLLERSAIGKFNSNNAVPITSLVSCDDINDHMISVKNIDYFLD